MKTLTNNNSVNKLVISFLAFMMFQAFCVSRASSELTKPSDSPNTTISIDTQKTTDPRFEGYQIKFDYKKYPEEREIGYQYYLDEESKYLPGIDKKI